MQQQGTHEGTHDKNCVIPNAAEMPKVETTKSRLYVPVVTSLPQDNLL